MSLYVIVSRYEVNKISKFALRLIWYTISRMIGNFTFSIRIHCVSWMYIFHFLFGKLARHSLNSLYVKKHEYFVLCSFQTSYVSLHIVKSNTYHVTIKSTLRQKLAVILNFRAKPFHIFSQATTFICRWSIFFGCWGGTTVARTGLWMERPVYSMRTPNLNKFLSLLWVRTMLLIWTNIISILVTESQMYWYEWYIKM